MLYFSLLHLYGTNDDWRKGRHNEGNVNRHPKRGREIYGRMDKNRKA